MAAPKSKPLRSHTSPVPPSALFGALNENLQAPGGESGRRGSVNSSSSCVSEASEGSEGRRSSKHSLTQNGGSEEEAGAPGGRNKALCDPAGCSQLEPARPKALAAHGACSGPPSPQEPPASRPGLWEAGGSQSRRPQPGPDPRGPAAMGSALTSAAPRELRAARAEEAGPRE